MAQQNEKQLSKHKTQVIALENQLEEVRSKLEQVTLLQAKIAELEAQTEGQAKLTN